jgi:hypothetical protein
MTKSIESIKSLRAGLIKITGELSTEQLNEVPPGFNNNIIWNMGHIIVAQQRLCYRRSGLDLKIDESFFLKYKPDTKPEEFVDQNEIENIKTLMLSTLGELETDYGNKLFKNYPTFTTRYGIELSSIEDAIDFLPFHDGLHMGYVMALKRLVSK